MGRRSPSAPVLMAAVLLVLIALLATLQYRWVARISDAERDRMRATLQGQAASFAQDFDRELTLAFMLFQSAPLLGSAGPSDPAAGVAGRYERWQTSARHPALIKEIYLTSPAERGGVPALERFDPAARAMAPAAWPEALRELREQLALPIDEPSPGHMAVFTRALPGPLWDRVPAVVVPAPIVVFDGEPAAPRPRAPAALSYTVLVLDREYIVQEMLPALAARHFRPAGNEGVYQLAVVRAEGDEVVFRSAADVAPAPGREPDAGAEMFRVRPQEFEDVAAFVRRVAVGSAPDAAPDTTPAAGGQPFVIALETAATVRDRVVTRSVTTAAHPRGARWQLTVTHPSGSLEAAVETARRRNLLVSTSILGVLGASLVLLVVSTRRAQELARQQMEFVATVTHELRTPLAVIRSAADNLADGVVENASHVRRYGELVRREGVRLSEMVEQVLELAGMGSGQRTFDVKPVDVRALVESAVEPSAALAEAAGIRVEVDMPADLPPVAGDASALRRAMQNLVGNAIKYGADGHWVGITGRHQGAMVHVRVDDRGRGIAPEDQPHIFQPFYRAPDVVAAQIPGAGLGLALVQRIVEAHGGRLTVTSTRGQGASFTVELPLAGEVRRPAGAAGRAALPGARPASAVRPHTP